MWYCKFMFNYPNGIVCKSCTAFCMKRLNERKEMSNFNFKERLTRKRFINAFSTMQYYTGTTNS